MTYGSVVGLRNEDSTLFLVIIIIIIIIVKSKMIIKWARHVISMTRKNKVLKEHRNKEAIFKKINK